MITKKQLNNWIEKIDKYRKDLHTGGGAMISSGFSKENEALYKSATTCRNLLTLYYSYEGLNEEHYKRLATVMEDVRQKSFAYENAKKNSKKNPYALHEDGRRGIPGATGDKYTRLKAADDLNLFVLQTMQPVVAEGLEESHNREPYKISKEFRKIDEKLGADNLSADDITKNMNKFIKKATPKMEIMNFHRSAINARVDYNNAVKNSFWGKEITVGEMKKDFLEINNLHRLDLIKYNNSNEFLKLYKNNRYKIRQVVDIYNWANKRKNGNENQQREYNLLRLSLGLTNKQFEGLAEKVSALEMIGRHMDSRIAMCTNPEFTKLGVDAIKNISSLSKAELGSQIKALTNNQTNPQMPAEYKPGEDSVKFLKSAYNLKNLEELGVLQKSDAHTRKENSLVDREVGDKLKRRFKFLNVQARIGRDRMKREFGAGDFDLPMLAKAKLGKISLKYKSKNELFSAGAHSGVLGGKLMGNVGIGFSLKNPLSTKVQVMGAAEAYGARGVAKAKVGNKDVNLEGKATGHIGHAKAEGTFGLGHIYKKNDKGQVTTDGFGVDLKAGASASVFNGKVSGGFSFFGIRISVEAEGKAIAAGLEGQLTFIPNTGIKLGCGGALGLGGNVTLAIEWGGLVKKYKNWKKRRAISKATLKQKKAEERERKLEEQKRRKQMTEAKKAIKEGAPDLNKVQKSKDDSELGKKNNSNNRIKRSNTLSDKKGRKL